MITVLKKDIDRMEKELAAGTIAERGARYGEFKDHAVIAQGLQDTMRAAPGWTRLAPDQKQALSVISDKIARMLNGDPDYVDNWHDITGYASLVEKRLVKGAAEKLRAEVVTAGQAAGKRAKK